jgi:hypothetical protein
MKTRWFWVVAGLALFMQMILQAATTCKITGWGRQVVFPRNGFGATFTHVAAGGDLSLALFDAESANQAPNFLGITATTGTVRLRGAAGQIYHLEASTNLLNWIKLDQATADPNGFFQFTDPDKNAFPRRFYRAAK